MDVLCLVVVWTGSNGETPDRLVVVRLGCNWPRAMIAAEKLNRD
jgi:hypothetical protein